MTGVEPSEPYHEGHGGPAAADADVEPQVVGVGGGAVDDNAGGGAQGMGGDEAQALGPAHEASAQVEGGVVAMAAGDVGVCYFADGVGEVGQGDEGDDEDDGDDGEAHEFAACAAWHKEAGHECGRGDDEAGTVEQVHYGEEGEE